MMIPTSVSWWHLPFLLYLPFVLWEWYECIFMCPTKGSIFFFATGCSTATAIFQKLIYQLQNVVQGFKIWQNDRNTRTFWFVRLLEQPATPKHVKDLIIGRQILMGIGEKHSKIPLITTTRSFTQLKLCKRPSNFIPTHPWLPRHPFEAFFQMSSDVRWQQGRVWNIGKCQRVVRELSWVVRSCRLCVKIVWCFSKVSSGV